MFALTNPQRIALAKPSVKRRLFIWCDAKNPLTGAPDPAGFWDDVGDVSYLGKVYHGSGNVIKVSTIEARGDLTIPGATIELSGIQTESINLVRAKGLDQAPISVSIGIFDTLTHELYEPLYVLFDGFINNVEFKTSAAGGDTTIELACESTSRALTAGRTLTQTDSNCRARYSTDAFYSYAAVQRLKPLYFGRAAPTT